MKLALLALCVGAFLAVPGIAAAATPQGKLTGSAVLGAPFLSSTFAIGTTVIDGGTNPLYIGKEDDKSGNCEGDSGTVVISGHTFNVVCAHFVASSACCNVGSPKMRVAYQITTSGVCQVVRITDNGASDTWAKGQANATLAQARAWVNKGAIGGVGGSWVFAPLTSGGYTVTA